MNGEQHGRSVIRDHYSHLASKSRSGGSVYDVKALVRHRRLRPWFETRRGTLVRILDIGCGRGAFLRDFAPLLSSTYSIRSSGIGIDLVDGGKNTLADVSGSFQYVQADVDGTPLPFPDDSFDIVVCNHVIEHVFKTEFLIREIHRVTDPRGFCEVSTPNLSCWINRLLLLAGLQPLSTEVATDSMEYGWPFFRARMASWTPPGHIRCFTAAALADLCRKHGLRPGGRWRQERRWLYRNIALICFPEVKRAGSGP